MRRNRNDKKEDTPDDMPEFFKQITAALKRDVLESFAAQLPDNVAPVTCGNCDNVLLGCFDSEHNEFGLWCTHCNRGGSFDAAGVLKESTGEILRSPMRMHHAEESEEDERSPLHPVHGN